MIKLFGAFIGTCILATGASSQQYFREDFTGNQRNWLVQETGDFAFSMNNGWYRLQSKKGGSWFTTIPVPATLSGDFEIKTTIRKISGTDGYFFGIIMVRSDRNGYHHFAGITGSGHAVLANKGSSPQDLISNAIYAPVRRGNVTNTLVVRKSNNRFHLLVNDQLIGSVNAESFFGNYFGFQIWSGNESLTVEMDDLVISGYSSTGNNSGSSSSQIFISDRASMNLKGQVTYVREYSRKATFTGSHVDNENLNICEYQFNSRGYFTKKSEEFTDCEPCNYKYGKDGYILITTMGKEGSEKLKHRFYKKGNLLAEEQYEISNYDDEEDDYGDLEFFGARTYKLDAQGRVLEQTEYFDESFKMPASRFVFKYDNNGRLTETRSEEFDDNTNKSILVARLVAQDFDAHGNPKTEIRYDENNKMITKVKYVYESFDDQNNWKSRFMIVEDYSEGNKKEYFYKVYRTIKY